MSEPTLEEIAAFYADRPDFSDLPPHIIADTAAFAWWKLERAVRALGPEVAEASGLNARVKHLADKIASHRDNAIRRYFSS